MLKGKNDKYLIGLFSWVIWMDVSDDLFGFLSVCVCGGGVRQTNGISQGDENYSVQCPTPLQVA